MTKRQKRGLEILSEGRWTLYIIKITLKSTERQTGSVGREQWEVEGGVTL